MAGLKHFAGVARTPFLLLPPTLVASGAAAAAWDGHFSWLHTLAALLGLVALHMAVNTLNEWSDMRTGIDLETERTPFSGGSGTLPGGGMSSRTALVFGLACAAVGLAVGLWFMPRIGVALVPLMVLGGVCVLAYTDVLARLGVGEVAAGFGLGAGPVVGTALVQDGSWSRAAVAAGVPAFFMTFNLLFLNEFPDEQADRHGGRRNLVILLGRRRAALVYAAAAIATPLSIAAAVVAGWLPAPALIGALPSLLLFRPLQWAAGDTEQPVPIPALAANVVWNLATNALLAVGLVIAILIR
ncbi:MAG: prenyltransferase [Thermoanaerobaculales bacterium]|jgi:1,4-dihydroxy-2-naphthoate octaprenyltransferase|nr:prenyltransferase [Thermoanaerobaculales bacterium]